MGTEWVYFASTWETVFSSAMHAVRVRNSSLVVVYLNTSHGQASFTGCLEQSKEMDVRRLEADFEQIEAQLKVIVIVYVRVCWLFYNASTISGNINNLA